MSNLPISVKDDDVLITANVKSLNFTGPGVQAIVDGDGNVEVEVAGCDGTGLIIQDEGAEVALDPAVVNFVGDAISAVQVAPGVVNVTVNERTGVIVQDEGVQIVSGLGVLNFVGGGVAATPGAPGVVTVTIESGGDPGGVGGNPLFDAQFPVGTYAYSDTGTIVPGNFLTINTPLILDVLSYPELAQVAELRNDFLAGIVSDVENNPYMDGFVYDYTSVYQNKHYIVLFRNNSTGACRAAVWKVVNRQFVFQTTIDLNNPPVAGAAPYQFNYNGEHLVVGYTGFVNRPSQVGDYVGRVVVYQGQGATWLLRAVIENPTPIADYRNLAANAAVTATPTLIPTRFARTIALHSTFFVVGTSGVRTEVSPGVFTIGRAYAFSYDGVLLNTIISPRTNIPTVDGAFSEYNGTFGEAVYPWGSTAVVFGTMPPPNYLSAGGVGHGAIFYTYVTPTVQTTPSQTLNMNDFGATTNSNNFSARNGLAAHNETDTAGSLLFAGAPDQQVGQISGVGVVIIIDLSTGLLFQTVTSPSVNSDSFGRVVDAQDDVLAVRAGFTQAGYAYRLIAGTYQLAADFGTFAPQASSPDEFYIWADTDTFISETDFNLFTAYLAPKLNNEIAAIPLPASSGKKTILRVQ